VKCWLGILFFERVALVEGGLSGFGCRVVEIHFQA